MKRLTAAQALKRYVPIQHNQHVQDWIAHAPVVLVMRWFNQVTADAMQRGWHSTALPTP